MDGWQDIETALQKKRAQLAVKRAMDVLLSAAGLALLALAAKEAQGWN